MEPRNARDRRNQQVLDEAAEWFVDLREGDLDAAGQVSFHSWLRASPDHIEAFLEVAALWADVPNVVSKEQVDVPALIAAARAEENVVSLSSRHRIPELLRRGRGWTDEPTKTPTRRLASARVAIAAAVLAGVACATWIFVYSGSTYTTAIGEQRSLSLEDGSTLEMNAMSRIRVHFNKHERAVDILEGQALFRIAKDTSRPFIVTSGTVRVRAVGTQFDVYRRSSATSVTVIEGRVAVVPDPVASRNEPQGADHPGAAFEDTDRDVILLSAGQQVVVSGHTAEPTRPANVSAVIAWTQHELVFHGAPLTDVVEEFNRYNRRQMVISDEGIKGVRVSGIFSSTEPTALLRFLGEVGFKVDQQENEIRISSR